MSRKVSNQIERVKLSEVENVDYVEVRPLSGAEKLRAFALLPKTGLMTQFITELLKLADKDPNNEMVKTAEKAVYELNKVEKKYNECIMDNKRFIMKTCIISAFDDGVKQDKLDNYIDELDDDGYKMIYDRIYELSFPTKEEADFLEPKDDKSQETSSEVVQ